MRKKFNPHQWMQSGPKGHVRAQSGLSEVKYTHNLFGISYPEELMDFVAQPASHPVLTMGEMPLLPDSLFANLPDFLQKVVAGSTSKEDRDILLLGALTTLSACLSKIHGLYDGMTVYPNIYLFVITHSSTGESRLSLCKQLVDAIHHRLREQNKLMKDRFDREMKQYKLLKRKDSSVEKPVLPSEKLLIIPANMSSRGIIRQLADNDGTGLIFETEGEVMAKALKTEYSNYTNVLRKSFQHEFMSYYRLAGREYREIESPRLSLVLSGTFSQLYQLIPSTENGLFSRFVFYFMTTRPEQSVFPEERDDSLDDYFNDLAREFHTFYEELIQHPDMTFHLTSDQINHFNYFFTQLNDRYLVLQDIGFIATIRRLGLVAYRLAMIFSALRILETGDFSKKKECLDVDFQASISIVRILVQHASYAYTLLPDKEMPGRKKNRMA